MKIFMSHNHRDKPHVRELATQLELAGAEVWFDEWRLEPGDSVVGKVNEALTVAEKVVVVWSANAAASRWVATEWETALNRHLKNGSVKVVPVRIDDTELPTMLDGLLWLGLDARATGGTSGSTETVVRSILGMSSRAAYVKAISKSLEWSGVTFATTPDGMAYMGCPKCGAESDELRITHATDDERGDEYYGICCQRCSWPA
ncbi:hypothetical protein GCM10022226_62150 [Sphaerisporangium flaviroseum]|uniref:TIR domain-containing protein n=1 Tax=Sphaerisporangium flaviroseum TaxID=509199 RepID=A0ABP7J363_9ACTN